MNRIGYLSKSISCLLMAVIFYMHFCSSLCATGAGSCCGKEDNESDHCKKKSCCSDKNKSEGKSQDCQGFHLSFFNTTGQFASDKSPDAIKGFQSLVAVVIHAFNILPVTQTKSFIVDNGFHPPPPKTDIRIFIQSFLI